MMKTVQNLPTLVLTTNETAVNEKKGSRIGVYLIIGSLGVLGEC